MVFVLLEGVNLSKSFGERVLFSGGAFKIEAGDKIGLIGANGTGKTTLFKIISGEEAADTGGIVRAGGTSVGILRQHACEGSTKTAYDEALTVFDKVAALGYELEDINDRLHTSQDISLIEKAENLRVEFERLGGLTYKARTRSALLGLGFSEDELNLTVDKLSGGQKSKIEIAKLLLSSPDIMLLDEPTNHLDIDAIEWLDSFIASSKSAAVIISHDRYFLDRVATKIISIEHGKIYCYNGNYTKYLEQRELRELSVQREYDNTMKEVKRIEGIIEQQKRWNREKNIKTAESKQKLIERLLDGLVIPDSELENMTLSFTADGMCGNEVLKAKNLTCSFGDRTLYRDVNIDMRKGDRVIMLGKNGCGKTTLLKALRDSGNFGVGVTIGYFDQHGGTLDGTKTIFSQLRDDFPRKTETELRSALALFMFKGDEVFREISTLSGGERARVALCILMLRRNNFLLLDEPTNHLDLESREILENALSDYDGTILAVSHDRYFINRIAEKILYFKDSALISLNGNYDSYLEKKQSEITEVKPEKAAGAGKTAYLQKKAERSALAKLKSGISVAEKEIERLEAEEAEIESALADPLTASDYEKTTELCEKLDKIKEALGIEMEKWENLSVELENFSISD